MNLQEEFKNTLNIEHYIVKKVIECEEVFILINKIDQIETYVNSKLTKLILTEIFSFYNKYEKAPSWDEIFIINKLFHVHKYLKLLKDMEDKINFHAFIDQAKIFFKNVKFRTYIEELHNSIDLRDITTEKVDDNLKNSIDYLDAILQLDILKSKPALDVIEDLDKLEEYLNSQSNVKIPCGIQNIDFWLNGGFKQKTMTVILAGTGVGKTLLCISIAKGIILNNNEDVLYFSLEISKEEMDMRIKSSLLQVKTSDITKENFNNIRASMNELKTKCKGRIQVLEYSPSDLTINELDAVLSDYKKSNRLPKVVIIDSANLIAVERGLSDTEKGQRIGNGLKTIQSKYNIAIITPTQFNREGIKKSASKSADLTDVGGSIYITQVADNLFAFGVDGKSITRLWGVNNKVRTGVAPNQYKSFNRSIDYQSITDDIAFNNNNKLPAIDEDDNEMLINVNTKDDLSSLFE